MGSSLSWKSIKFLTSSRWYSLCSFKMRCLFTSSASSHLRMWKGMKWMGYVYRAVVRVFRYVECRKICESVVVEVRIIL